MLENKKKNFMKRNKIDAKNLMLLIMTIIVFSISPILLLVPILFGIFLKKKIHITLAIFTAILSYNFIPNKEFDLARHWSVYIFFKDKNIYEFINFLKIQKDYIVYIISFVLSKFGFRPSCLNLITTFIAYYFYFKNFENFENLKIQKKIIYTTIIITYLLMFDLFFVISGIRMALSTAIFIYGLFSYIKNKKIKNFIVYSIFSISIHIFMINVFIAFLISLKIKNKKILKTIFYVSLLFTILPIKGEYILKIIEIIPILKNYSNHIAVYLIGHESFIDYSNLNWKGIIKYMIYYKFNYWLFFISIILFLKNSNFRNEKIEKFIFLLYININFLSQFSVIQERLIYISTPIIYLYIIISENKLNQIKKIWIYLVLLFFILKNIFIINQYKIEINNSYKNFYKYNLFKSNQIKNFNEYYDFEYIQYITKRKNK
ncbi:MAG: EpsG family protein [Fusobacteriaceae bacterium]